MGGLVRDKSPPLTHSLVEERKLCRNGGRVGSSVPLHPPSVTRSVPLATVRTGDRVPR